MSGKTVKRAYKYRFYPSAEQEVFLAQTFGCVRYVYNRTLAERSEAYTQHQEKVSYADASRWITAWKKDEDTAWLADVSNVPLQQAQRHLQSAFVAFWDKRAKYPRFKKRQHRQSATFTRGAFRVRDGDLYIAKQSDPLDVVMSRPLPDRCDVSSITLSRDPAGRYFVSMLCETEVRSLPRVSTEVGVDAGITTLMSLSTGEKISNPRHYNKDFQKLKHAQQNLSRKKKGSNNQKKARRKVARVHARIADSRRDHLHKLSTRLVRENQTIYIEDLAVRNMVRNRSLARAISDASWSMFRGFLEYKADWYGREVVAIDRWYPSTKTCSQCGMIVPNLPLNIREWECLQCHTHHDRDVNAAKNILAVGHAVSVCGDSVRPARAKHDKAVSVKQKLIA